VTPYLWLLPIAASIFWVTNLLALMLWWNSAGQPVVRVERPGQIFPFISDLATTQLWPMFIAFSILTALTIDIAFFLEPFVRKNKDLDEFAGSQTEQRVQFWLLIAGFIISLGGLVGLGGLAIAREDRDNFLHNTFLRTFAACYTASGVLLVTAHFLLSRHHPESTRLRLSWIIKTMFMIVIGGFGIAFLVFYLKKNYTAAAEMEWVDGFLFGLYLASYAGDYWVPCGTVNMAENTSEFNKMQDP